MNFNNRTYATINISELENINYSEILQDSKDSVRKSNDDNLFIITWLNNEIPSFISNNSITPAWTGNHDQMMLKLKEENWFYVDEMEVED